MHLHQEAPGPSEDAVAEAVAVYEAEYRERFPTGGDYADHQEAIWHAVAAVLMHVKENA